MLCETCRHEGKPLIKILFCHKWYKCRKCKEMIGEIDDPIKDKQQSLKK